MRLPRAGKIRHLGKIVPVQRDVDVADGDGYALEPFDIGGDMLRERQPAAAYFRKTL